MDEKLVEDMTRRARTVAESIRRPGGKDSKAGKMLYEMATALTAAQARIRELEGALAARSAEPVAWRWRYDGERAWTLCKRKPALWPDAEMKPLYAHPKEAPDV